MAGGGRPQGRQKRVGSGSGGGVFKRGGKDTVTVMVYICASDLKPRSGMATADLNEMLHADIAESVNSS